jgi:hypothetical protein
VNTTPAPTSTTLSSSANPAAPSVPVTLTAIETALGTDLPGPSGIVTFVDQATNQILGTAPVGSQGVASLSVALSGNGSHPLVASFGGTLLLDGSSSAPLVELVTPDLATTTRVIARRFVAQGTQWVNLKVTVAPLNPLAGMPTGSVTLSLGTYRFAKLLLKSGSAQMNVRLAVVAHHIISSYYPGNGVLYSSGSPFLKLSPARCSAGGGRQACVRLKHFARNRSKRWVEAAKT